MRVTKVGFDFGNFLMAQVCMQVPDTEITTLVIEGVTETHDGTRLCELIHTCRGNVCSDRYLDMIAARFRTPAQAGRAYNRLISAGCGNRGEFQSLRVTGCSCANWKDDVVADVAGSAAWEDAVVADSSGSSLRKKRPRGGKRTQKMKQKRARRSYDDGDFLTCE